MMKPKTVLAAGVLAAALAGGARADADALARMADTLKAAYPATQFRDLRATPVPGLWEVTMGANVAYVEDSGRYFLFGHLFDMREQRDLTADSLEAASRIDFVGLPLEDAITEVRGAGSRKLVVFSDPDCPYCRKLEQELARLDDVTIHTFLYPLEQLHPQAREKSMAVWCAPDRLAAWRDLMRASSTASMAGAKTGRKDAGKGPADCPNPIDRNIELARRLAVQGTPALFDARGRRLAGAAPLAAIEDFLAGGAGK